MFCGVWVLLIRFALSAEANWIYNADAPRIAGEAKPKKKKTSIIGILDVQWEVCREAKQKKKEKERFGFMKMPDSVSDRATVKLQNGWFMFYSLPAFCRLFKAWIVFRL